MPLLVRHIAQKARMRYACAQRQRVHAVIHVQDLIAHALGVPAVGQIAAHGVRIHALGAKLLRQRACGVVSPVSVQQHGIALPGQFACAGRADAAGSARDERDFLSHLLSSP